MTAFASGRRLLAWTLACLMICIGVGFTLEPATGVETSARERVCSKHLTVKGMKCAAAKRVLKHVKKKWKSGLEFHKRVTYKRYKCTLDHWEISCRKGKGRNVKSFHYWTGFE